jgi:hypothetical protein
MSGSYLGSDSLINTYVMSLPKYEKGMVKKSFMKNGTDNLVRGRMAGILQHELETL